MSKREEIRERRRKDQLRNRVLVVSLVVAGALLITFALIKIGSEPPAALPPQGSAPSADQPVTPAAPRSFNTTVDGAHLGSADAPVKVDVWEDFQCPACKSYSEGVEPFVIQDYVDTGKVYYTFHFYPFIDRGAPKGESHQAANAAMCALEQGRFWDYHDLLFANWNGENQGGFADPKLLAFARHLALDMNTFNACFSENRFADQIQQDLLMGQSYGVNGTPSVFVNGTIVTPGYIPSYQDMADAIEAALSAAGQ